ncbi:nucleotidyltransferase family protein [Anaerococcus hydrogenalis]|uniref:tRNA(Met) cytidine acetate ligase n=2 Tax=Anaerococcus hydrogenalis TaxID=33029 RepID=A0A2N6ULD3_9FIRM|nr:nucleotidyltransferase family protein [Anaerococcus hydrogenalis]MDK7694645.1 nucleotidyltransferase family protein [Anaerococcus hydrogenalis]MDK7696423.1 nucleotidyltransferase family protein [Anaerococcus hydrogenalis]MDK7707672.1 nucleotidyltransferase family protein [Anaerococcus hydrogenalis]PMC82683.1 nucleotidyltransferase [Anaerococcus hydrogenalis]
MKKLAIISEYNPFHNGHNFIQKKAKEITKANLVIAIMSGDFVQRGEPSLIDKYKRADSAMISADLIIEMPSFISLQSANLFARKNIEILNKLKIDYLAFGIENISEEDFFKSVENILNNNENIDKKTKYFLDKGLSFSKASYEASKTYALNEDFFSANNILALEYIRAIKNSNSKIKAIPIKRIKSMNKDKNLDKKTFASSTAIRNNINNSNIKSYLPESSLENIEKFKNQYNNFPDMEKLYELFRYKILIENINMSNILCYEEGMDNYLKKLAEKNFLYNDFINEASSLRFTKSRIKRLMINYLLENTIDLNNIEINFIKVLAFNEKSTRFFKDQAVSILIQKKDEKKLKDNEKIIYDQMIKASNLYSFLINRNMNSDFTQKITIKNSSNK